MPRLRRAAPIFVAVTLTFGLLWLVVRNGDERSLIRASDAEAQTEDLSCHDPRALFTDGATRISAIFRIDLKATNDDWPKLTRLMETFAMSHGLSLRNTSISQPGVVKTLEIDLCAANQPQISINEQRWASTGYAPIPGRGIAIRLYGDVPESAWHPIASELVAALESRWPDRVKFLNGGGYQIDRPEFLSEANAPSQP